jgi:hypothetical protein
VPLALPHPLIPGPPVVVVDLIHRAVLLVEAEAENHENF